MVPRLPFSDEVGRAVNVGKASVSVSAAALPPGGLWVLWAAASFHKLDTLSASLVDVDRAPVLRKARARSALASACAP